MIAFVIIAGGFVKTFDPVSSEEPYLFRDIGPFSSPASGLRFIAASPSSEPPSPVSAFTARHLSVNVVRIRELLTVRP